MRITFNPLPMSGVSGTGIPLAFAIARKATSAEKPFRISKQATIIAERPMPARQWTATRFPLPRSLFRLLRSVSNAFRDAGTERSSTGNERNSMPQERQQSSSALRPSSSASESVNDYNFKNSCGGTTWMP